MSLRDEMNRIFQDMWGDDSMPTMFGGGASFPAVDIIESDKDIKVKAELLGMDPENVDVSINDGCLIIQGERKDERKEEDKQNNYLRREISYGSFCRSIALPDAANIEDAHASFENGILNVDIPKKAESLGKSRKLQITKQGGEQNRGK
jgi:HSP20 family protein